VQSSLRIAVVTALLVAAVGCGRTTGSTNALVAIGAGLRGPEGLHATVYARGIPHVSALAFDQRGRLWATGSGATTHAGDGVYEVTHAGARASRVVSGPPGPLGVVWIGDRLYVSSLGAVTRFSGLSHGRFANRTVIVSGPVPGGENNNLVRAPDGRLLMGISSTCDHCVPASPWAATIVSFRPDGSGLAVFARGIRAAFGLAFVPGTDDLLATMNQRDDLGSRTPGDWLALVRRGDNWRSPACYGQGGTACRGVRAPIAVLDPHAAAGGVTVLTTQLGGRFSRSALVAEWQTGRVLRVALRRAAAGYRGTVSGFLTGITSPLPVVTAPDGSVLVGDWRSGVVYRIAG